MSIKRNASTTQLAQDLKTDKEFVLKKSVRIGVLLYGEGAEFFDDMKQGFLDRLTDLKHSLDLELISKQTKADPESQLKVLKSFEKQNISGLVISPVNDERIRERIDRFVEKGVPVVCVNNDLPESKRFAFVGCDNYKSGETAGGLMGLFTGGKAEVAVINGTPGVKGLDERIRGFKNACEKNYPGVHVEVMEDCFSDDYKTYETVQRILLDNPGITAFYFTSGGIYGGCKAIYQLTQRYPFTILTYEMTASTREYLEKGIITASICQNPYDQGVEALNVITKKIFFDTDPKNEITHADIYVKIKESL